MPMRPTWSSAIDTVIQALNSDGVRVEINRDLDVSGRCHYANEPNGPKIELNAPRAKEALFVLAHEAGHCIASNIVDDYLEMPVEAREEIADDFGFLIVNGAAPCAVSRREYDDVVGVVPSNDAAPGNSNMASPHQPT